MSCASRVRFPPPLSPAGSSELPKSTPPAHSWNQLRAVTLESPLHVVTRRSVTSLKLGSCVSSRTRRNQVSVTFHTQTLPLPSQARPSQAPGRVPVFHHAAPYETASALAPWPSLEVGMATRYSPGLDYTGLLQNLQPVDRSLIPSGRSAPGAGIQACCGIHGPLNCPL